MFLDIAGVTGTENIAGFSGTESILKLIGLIILCILIIAASFFVTRFIGRRETGMSGNSNFKAIDAYRLGPNRFIQLVQIGSRYFVIAVSKDNINLICELDKEDIRFRTESRKISFKEIMARAVGKKTAVSAEEEQLTSSDQKDDISDGEEADPVRKD